MLSQSGLNVQKLNLNFTPFQPIEDVAAVIDGRSVVLEIDLELRQDGPGVSAELNNDESG